MAADGSAIGPEEWIAHWVRDHAAALRGYLLGTTGRHDVADDLVQQVFQRAWQARDRYRDVGQERAFLLKIADRLVKLGATRFDMVYPGIPGTETLLPLLFSEGVNSSRLSLERFASLQLGASANERGLWPA